MLSSEAKKGINTFVPIAVAGVAGYTAYRKNVRWQMLLVVVGLAWLLTWVLSRQATKIVTDVADRPKVVPAPQDGVNTVFDAGTWAAQLRDDLYTVFRFRDSGLYAQLVTMSDAQLTAIGNEFNRRYYSEHKENLVQAMKAEQWGNDWFSNVAANAQQIINRLQRLGF